MKLLDRILTRLGYRKVPPRNVGAVWIDCNPAELTAFGHKRRSRAFIARRIAEQVHDALDRYEAFGAEEYERPIKVVAWGRSYASGN